MFLKWGLLSVIAALAGQPVAASTSYFAYALGWSAADSNGHSDVIYCDCGGVAPIPISALGVASDGQAAADASSANGGTAAGSVTGFDNVHIAEAHVRYDFAILGPGVHGIIIPANISAYFETDSTGSGEASASLSISSAACGGYCASWGAYSYTNPPAYLNGSGVLGGLQTYTLSQSFGFALGVLYTFDISGYTTVNYRNRGYDPSDYGNFDIVRPGTASFFADPHIVIDPAYAKRYYISGGLLDQPPPSTVPEPASWLLMAMGFGIAGSRIRQPRRLRAT